MKKFIALVLLGLLLLPSATNATSGIEIISRSGDGYWDGDTWYVDLYPGEIAETTLRLRNCTSKPVRVGLNATLDKHYDKIILWWGDSEFTIPREQTREATLYVEAYSSVPPSKYTNSVTIVWREPRDDTEKGSGYEKRGRERGEEATFEEDRDKGSVPEESIPVVSTTTSTEPIEPTLPTVPASPIQPNVFPWWWIAIGLLASGLGFTVYKIRRQKQRAKWGME